MVRFDDISQEARQVIVAGAAPLLALHDEVGLGAPGQPLALGPSLHEELLTLDAVRGAAESAPQPTGQTVSLLQAPGEHATLGAGPGQEAQPFGYVRAGPGRRENLGAAAPADWSVTAVSASDLSARIQTALEWIDRAVSGDPVVRVLTVPAYQITALTLHHGDKVVGVVALPSRGETHFEAERVYALDEFIGRLRELPPAEGITFGGTQDDRTL
jgi:hypothetical protein